MRITGKVEIHALKMSISYVYEGGFFKLGVNLLIPDHELRRAAVSIAAYIKRPVIWQDIVGRFYCVYPDGRGSEYISFKDPRSIKHYRRKKGKQTHPKD